MQSAEWIREELGVLLQEVTPRLHQDDIIARAVVAELIERLTLLSKDTWDCYMDDKKKRLERKLEWDERWAKCRSFGHLHVVPKTTPK